MELKWLMIAFGVSMAAIAASQAVEQKAVADCKTAYVQSTKSAEEIKTICSRN